jgi:small GTP-binding protein
MVERLLAGTFSEQIDPTVAVEFHTFVCQLENHVIRLQIWDTGGQERFKSLSTSYFRDAVGAILVYDLTKESTFEDLASWLNDLRQLCHPNAFFLLVGNKCDCEEERKVGAQQAQELADQYRLEFLETSAKSGENIERTFTRLAYEIGTRVDNGEIEVRSKNARAFSAAFDTEEESSGCKC